MSYDLTIFFPHAEFPASAWYDLLASFRSSECEVSFEQPIRFDPRTKASVMDCRIAVDHSLLGIGVDAEEGPSRRSCAPQDARWGAHLSTTMGRSFRAFFIQHAVPYHALVFFPGVTVHDCQYHVGRSLEASSWSTPEGWLAIAERRLWSMGRKENLVDHGLFHPDGRIRF